MPLWWPFPVAFAFLLTAFLTPLVMRIAVRFHVVDEPKGGRKIHDRTVPLLGGLAIYVGLSIPLLLVLTFSNHLTAGEIDPHHIFGFLLGGAVLMVGGYLDDRYSLPPKRSVLFPVAAAVIATMFGIGIEKITNPFGGFIYVLPAASLLFTFLWLLSMTYATKLLDGIDGLATSVALIGALMIVALALTEEYFQPDVVLFAVMFGAALFGFLLWNFPVARIFLGEGGSTFIGFTLGVLAVIAGSKVATTLLVLGIPILDVVHVAIWRWKEGRSFTSGDRYHLHHLLLDNGLTQRQVVIVYSSLCLLFGLSTLVFSSFEKLLALLALSVFIFILILVLHRRKKIL